MKKMDLWMITALSRDIAYINDAIRSISQLSTVANEEDIQECIKKLHAIGFDRNDRVRKIIDGDGSE